MSLKKKAEKLTKELEEQAFAEENAGGAEVVEPQEVSLTEKIVELEKETAEWKDKYLRSMAEFENFRRRSNQEKADWIKLATQDLALKVCDVADNFERALAQVDEAVKADGFVKGVVLIEQQLRSILEKEGVRKLEALGEEFDPAKHEALAHIPSEYEENIVAAVIQNGYEMHGKVVRPVRVAVSSGKIAAETPDTGAEQASGGEQSETIEIEVQ